MKEQTIFGVGIKDNEYSLVKKEYVGGKWKRVWACPYYLKWKDMLMRCYSEKYLAKNPSYRGCTVCEEWLTFSNFKSWMEQQDWEGKELDKDLLLKGNKLYSPSTCIFIDQVLNTFLVNQRNGKGLLGASWHQRDKVYGSNISNPFTGCTEFLGNFKTEQEAHTAWCFRKKQLIEQLIVHLKITDSKIIDCLQNRY